MIRRTFAAMKRCRRHRRPSSSRAMRAVDDFSRYHTPASLPRRFIYRDDAARHFSSHFIVLRRAFAFVTLAKARNVARSRFHTGMDYMIVRLRLPVIAEISPNGLVPLT